ncbi:unnamed protein product [Peronospora effusa]|nr:unnamed protein product [Peronospora effusa]
MCLYFKYVGDTCTVVGVYVDDLLVTGTDPSAVENFFKDMAGLSIKDLGAVNKFLVLRIKLDESKWYILDQQVTIESLLKEFGLDSANGVRTPIGDECNLEDEPLVVQEAVWCVAEHHGGRIHRGVSSRTRATRDKGTIRRIEVERDQADADVDRQSSGYQADRVGEEHVKRQARGHQV